MATVSKLSLKISVSLLDELQKQAVLEVAVLNIRHIELCNPVVALSS